MKQNKIPRNEYIRKPVGKTNPYKEDVIYSNLGQWKYPGQVTRIPSGDITMQGVPYPVYGEDNLGYSQMMYPGMDYQFPGQYVTEIPMAQEGEEFSDYISDYKRPGPVASENPDDYLGWWQNSREEKSIPAKQKNKKQQKNEQAPIFVNTSNSKNIPILNPSAAPTYISGKEQNYMSPERRAYEQQLANIKAQKREQVEDRDSWLENIAEIIDPTGISSWDDIYRAYKNTGLGKETAVEVLGAIPFLGKVGKAGKLLDALTRTLAVTARQKRNAKATAAGLKAIGKYGPTSLRGSDAIQAALGSKDNSGFTWDMRHGEVPMYNGRNIFPQIQLGEHGDFAYGGDPSLSDITGHYPFGGQNTKTHTHMSKGGWLDELPEANDGLNLRPHKAVAETTRIGKKDIPSSLDTLKTLAANRANRPWNQWSDKEKEDYINNPPKKMSPAQAEEWHNRAYEWSSEKAKKDKINEYVQQSVHNTLYNNPLWNSAISFTPAGSVLSLMKGTMNLGPDVYQTVKNPNDLKNYANIASDLLSMSRVSGTNIGSTGLKRVKDIKLLSSPHGDGLDIGDIKKVYDTKEKFQNKKQTGGNVSDLWVQTTGTPWTEAKTKGLTDGSYQGNIALKEKLLKGEFGAAKKSTIEEKPVSTSDSLNIDANSFDEAFKIARQTLGKNQIFEFNGRKYGTNLAGEEFTPSEDTLAKANLNNTKTKERLKKENEKVVSPYTDKNTVKLEPEYKKWDDIKQDQLKENKNDQASIIINHKNKQKTGKNYIIVDKQKGLMHVYQEGKSEPMYTSAVDIGKNPGDAQTVTKYKDTNKDGKITDDDKVNGKFEVDWSAGNMTTGAGKYYISNIDEKGYEGLPILNMMNETQYDKFKKTGNIESVATSFHSGFIKDDESRISNGCIRCNKTSLDNLVKNIQNSSEVYILPEDPGNTFAIENGKLNFKVKSKKNYNEYVDANGIKQKGQGINKTNSTLNYKPIKLELDENTFRNNVFQTGDSNDQKEFERTTVPYIKSLQDNKQKIMKAAQINGDVYNEIAKMSFGIYGTESNYGDTHSAVGNLLRAANKLVDSSSSSSPDYKAKYSTYGADEDYRSVGLTQIRWSELSNKEKEVLKKLDIKSNSDFLNPEKAAIATTAILGVRYNEQLNDSQKEDLWNHLPTKWNTRANYPKRVKDNSRYLTVLQLDGEEKPVKKDYKTPIYDMNKQFAAPAESTRYNLNLRSIPKKKNGGWLDEYQKKGEVQNIPKTKQLPVETTRVIKNPKIETVNKVVPYMPRYGDSTGANIYNNFIVQDRFKESKDFLNKWYTSPKYKEMISKSIEGDPNISKDKFYRTDNYPLPYRPVSDPYTTARLANLNESYANYSTDIENNQNTAGYASDNAITILPLGLNSKPTMVHELSHASDYYLKNTHAGVPWHSSQETYERAIPKKDIDLMSKYADINPFNRGWDEYVANPTETRARLNAIREGAYKNKLYNPFNEKVTPETYKKLLRHKFEDAEGMEGFEPLKQLQGIYSDEEIIDLLNSVSKTKNRTSEPVSKYGGLLNNYNEDDFRRGGPYTPPKLKRKVKKQGTSKNIQSSINKIFTRNYDVFGPGGKNIYNPNVYKTGGWLDNLD